MDLLLEAIYGILKSSWAILLDSGAYVIFGLAVAGFVNVFVKSEIIVRQLGRRNFRSVLLSSLFGIPLPLCSCGVVPTAISLYERGASKGATVSFLVSTPETGVDSIAISYALLDPLMTVFRPVAAFVTAIFAGSLENAFSDRRMAKTRELTPSCAVCGEEEGRSPHNHPLPARIRGGFRYAFVELLGDISRWLLLGIVIAGAISYFVPGDLITEKAGYGWPAMFIMALAGIPLYMCATSSTPIAAALVAKGVSPGAALVFLLTGPASNAASLVLVTRFLGTRATIVYLCSILCSSLLCGWLLNHVYRFLGLSAVAIAGRGAELVPSWLKVISGVGLLLLILYSIWRQRTNETRCCEEEKEGQDVCHIKD